MTWHCLSLKNRLSNNQWLTAKSGLGHEIYVSLVKARIKSFNLMWQGPQAEARWSAIVLFLDVVAHCIHVKQILTICSVQAIWAQITNNIAFQRLVPISHCIPACYIRILICLGSQSEAWWSAIELFQHLVAHCNTNTDDFLRTSNMDINYRQHRLPMVDADLPLHPSMLYSHSTVPRIPIRSLVISHWTVQTCCSTL